MGTSRPALLIVTHIDWDHAWQRPQAMATALAADHDVTVAAPVARRRGESVTNPREGVNVLPLWRVPGSLRSRASYSFNKALARVQLDRIIRQARPRRIIASAPECGAWIGERHGIPVAYDCMDDALAFPQAEAVRMARAADEHALLEHASLVVCSADALVARCLERGASRERIVVIPNGYDPAAFAIQPERELPHRGPLKLGYFGTIADWLDFVALERIVDRDSSVEIRLIGPIATAWRPRNPRIRVLPPMRNADLAAAVEDCNAMLVPFHINALTRAIDPVKLYEYIALGRPIACVEHPGLARFAPHVTFYDDGAQLAEMIHDRTLRSPTSVDARAAFLADATWSARAAALRRAWPPI